MACLYKRRKQYWISYYNRRLSSHGLQRLLAE